MTAHIESEQDWLARVTKFGHDDTDHGPEVADDDADVAALMADGADGDDESLTQPIELDEAQSQDARPDRYDRKVAWKYVGLAGTAVVATLVLATVCYSPDSPSAPAQRPTAGVPAAVAVARPTPSAGTAAGGVDRPLPYTADAQGSCAAGSTPAQTMSGNDPRNAFKCVRGGADGQTIRIDLGRTFVITAISITPGWVGKDASGVSQWSQHRVVTLVQYEFDHDPSSLVTQDTKNVHGEAIQPIKHQLASTIQLLIRQTSRPPAEPQQSSGPTPGDSGLTGIFGPSAPNSSAGPPTLSLGPAGGPSSPGTSDPVDASFAIGNLKVIGHEAI